MPYRMLSDFSRRRWMLFLCVTPLLAAPAEGPTTAMVGQVVDAKGAPVPDAVVLLTGLPTPDGLPTAAKGTTDADGRFELDRPADLAGDGIWRPVMLWVHRPGDRFGRVSYPGALPGPGEVVRVELPTFAPAEFHVEGPDGGPIAGAKLRVIAFPQYYGGLPKELTPKLETTTDAAGRATLDTLAAEELNGVEVEAEGLGMQQSYFQPPLPGPKRIVLRRVGALEGRFVTEGGQPLKKWTVSASTFPNDQGEGQHGTTGRTEIVPLPKDGTFSFPTLASGSLNVSVDWPAGPDPDLLPDWPKRMAVVAGQLNRVEIPVRPAATITGVIRERGTGAPVPGVKLYIFRQGESQGANTTTDAEGRFQYTSLPGKARIGIGDVPPSYVKAPAAFRDEFVVPAPPGHVELPPVELAKAAPPLRGIVRDAAGASLVGAEISGDWYVKEEGAAMSGSSRTRSGADGRFTVTGLAPNAMVTFTATKGSLATATPVAAWAGQDGDVTLSLVPGKTVSVTGKVVDPEGKPLAGAAVHLNGRTRQPGNAGYDWRGGLSYDGAGWIYTGTDGMYRTPGEPKREGDEFQAEAVANGHLKVQGPWTPAGEADVVRLPDLVLRPEPVERLIAGRVVDAAGKPVAGVRVLQRGDGPRPTEAKTDADGRFRLPGVADSQALIAAEAAGFRFGGAIVGNGPVEIRLARSDEEVRPLARAPEPLTRAAERALGVALLQPKLDEMRKGQQVVGILSPDSILARLAPDRVMAMLEDRVVQQSSAALVQIALSRFEDDPAAAVKTLDADRSGVVRGRGLLALADLAVVYAPERRADLLDRAMAEARRIERDEAKVLLMGEIADRWLESFDLDHAVPILREGQAILKTAKLPIHAYQVAPFGEALAAVDRHAAEAFLAKRAPGGSDDVGVKMRDRGAMAIRLAVADPAAAEQLARELHKVPNYSELYGDLLRIARSMARADLPRARKVLDLLDRPDPTMPGLPGPLKPYGLALFAEARAEIDPDGSRALLDEAFEGLRAVEERNPGQPTYPPVASIMAGLLPLVERLQPDRVAERLWLAVACRPSRPETLDANQASRLLGLALLVSRYDREMAAVIYKPVGARLPELAGQEYSGGLSGFNDGRETLKILAAYDPRALTAFIDHLPEAARVTRDNGQGWVQPSLEIQARLSGAEMLGIPPDARRHAAMASRFGVWPVEGNGRYGRQWP